MAASGPNEMKRVTDVRVLRTYVTLTLLSTLAASFIWGINTLFLLDAGLSITQAFAANAFFTAGQVLFEVPTGVVADVLGRRTSYLLGSATLFVSTLLYFLLWRLHGPFPAWAIASILLGLGFTFFSGATEAWLVDALHATGFHGHLDHVFGRAQTAAGLAIHARYRVRTGPRGQRGHGRPQCPERLHRRWAAQPSGPLADAGRSVHG